MVIQGANNQKQKPRYLVLGASGMLGSRIFEDLSLSFETFGTFHNSRGVENMKMRRINLTNIDEVVSLIQRIRPSHIINCIGLTNVEKCELFPEASWKLNSDVPFRLAKITSDLNVKFIHISTDHFASREDLPRSEMDLLYGVNQYGFTKLLGEKLILLENPGSLILRTNFFGTSNINRKSLLSFAMNRIRDGIKIDGFEDVIFSPVGIEQICRFFKSINSEGATGIVNFASDRPLSKYEFMVLVSKALRSPEAEIVRSSILLSSLTTKRPNYLALNPRRLIGELGFSLPSIEEMLDSEIKRAV